MSLSLHLLRKNQLTPFIRFAIRYLANNRINQVKKDVFNKNQQLELLDIRGNPIQHVHHEAFSNLPKLKKLYVEMLDENSTLDLEHQWHFRFLVQCSVHDSEFKDFPESSSGHFSWTFGHWSMRNSLHPGRSLHLESKSEKFVSWSEQSFLVTNPTNCELNFNFFDVAQSCQKQPLDSNARSEGLPTVANDVSIG